MTREKDTHRHTNTHTHTHTDIRDTQTNTKRVAYSDIQTDIPINIQTR